MYIIISKNHFSNESNKHQEQSKYQEITERGEKKDDYKSKGAAVIKLNNKKLRKQGSLFLSSDSHRWMGGFVQRLWPMAVLPLSHEAPRPYLLLPFLPPGSPEPGIC